MLLWYSGCTPSGANLEHWKPIFPLLFFPLCDLHCTWHSQCSRKLKEIYCLYNFLSWLRRTRSTSKCIARPCQRRQFYYIHVHWKRANLISQKCFRPSRCLQNEQTPKFDTREIVTSMKDEIITASGPSTERHGKKIFLTSSEEEVPISVRLAGAPINEPKNVEPMTHFLLIIICWWEYSRSPEIFNSIFGHSFAFYALSEWLLVFLSLRFSNCFFFCVRMFDVTSTNTKTVIYFPHNSIFIRRHRYCHHLLFLVYLNDTLSVCRWQSVIFHEVRK